MDRMATQEAVTVAKDLKQSPSLAPVPRGNQAEADPALMIWKTQLLNGGKWFQKEMTGSR